MQLKGIVENIQEVYPKFYRVSVTDNSKAKYTLYANGKVIIEKYKYYEFDYIVKSHAKYGNQNYIADYKEIQPLDSANIVKVLQKSIKGVGEKSAKKIYETLGDTVFIQLLEDPNVIDTVKLSQSLKDKIKESFTKDADKKDVLIQLQGYGLSYTEAVEFMNEMDDMDTNPIQAIKDNPFLPYNLNSHIGFMKSLSIAMILGFPKTHFITFEETIRYILNQAEQEGHSYLPYENVLNKIHLMLTLPKEEVKMIFDNLEMSKKEEDQHIFIKREDKIFKKKLFALENQIAYYLYKIDSNKISNYPNIEKYITEFENEEKITLNELQKQAVINALENKVSLLTGGPGTGKTQTIKAIIYVGKKLRLTFAQCAPTGMASKRVQTTTGEVARTIHRTLDPNMSTGTLRFLKDQQNTIAADLLIADESSMIDMYLFYYLIRAVDQNNTRLLLVGDPDQLEPVGAGKVFEDLIESGVFAHTHLDLIYRQGENSLITENAHRINKGLPLLLKSDDHIKDFYYIHNKSSQEAINEVNELIESRLPNKYGYDPLRDIQILMPRKKGDTGVTEYNKTLQAILNRSEEQVKGFKVGDKVMQIANDEEHEIFNGDIGFVSRLDVKNEVVYVDYDGNEIVYNEHKIDELELAYCSTIHKSQGSEYPVVIIPLLEEDKMMLYKKIIYTAITRGKALVILVGDIKYLQENLDKPQKKRRTNLKNTILRQFGFEIIKEEEIKVEVKEENNVIEFPTPKVVEEDYSSLASVQFVW